MKSSSAKLKSHAKQITYPFTSTEEAHTREVTFCAVEIARRKATFDECGAPETKMPLAA
jgi:hypothetical protein